MAIFGLFFDESFAASSGSIVLPPDDLHASEKHPRVSAGSLIDAFVIP